MAARRMYSKLPRNEKKQLHILISCAVITVLAFCGTAFVFIFLGVQPNSAYILVAFGNSISHGSLFCFAVVFFARGSRKDSFRRRILEVSARRTTRGTVCCLIVTFAAAVLSMVCLKLRGIEFILVSNQVAQLQPDLKQARENLSLLACQAASGLFCKFIN
jgi:hypothetical protein